MHQAISRLLWLSLFSTTIPASLDLAAAPQQNNAEQPSAYQLAKDSYAALQVHDYAAARDAARKAIAIAPKYPIAWAYLAHAYAELGDLPKAEVAYKILIEINPRYESVYNGLGVIYRKMGRTDDAVASFRAQLEVAPRNGYAAMNLAKVLALQGHWEEARQLADLPADVPPVVASRWVFLGEAQIKTGRVDEARRSLDTALSLPHEPSIENGVAYTLAEAGLDLDRSWKLISGALEQVARPLCEPEGLPSADKCTTQLRQLAYMLDTAGWVLYRQGNLQQAEPYLRSSLAITPRDVGELHLAVVLAKTGRLQEAINLFAQARVRPDFDGLETKETLHELSRAAGGDAERDMLLARAPLPASPTVGSAKAVVLVDGKGKVIAARQVTPAGPGVAELAKSLTLPALSWPGHSIRSIRTVEFQQAGERWSLLESYVGQTPPPPKSPCDTLPKQPLMPILVTQDTTQYRGCSGAF